MREEEQLFNSFINELRKNQGCTMLQLCEGLCTAQEIFFLENGRRIPEKLLQDALLERLGIGAEDYEHYLNYIEYDRWKIRQNILHSIIYEEMEKAEKMLAEYYTTCEGTKNSSGAMENKLEKQFYLSMLVQIRRYNGASAAELHNLLDEAIHLTVPALADKPITELILSIKELNLILEKEHYRKDGERAAQYQDIIKYIENRRLDSWSMAKIYPKAVFFLCRSMISANPEKIQTIFEMTELLRLCNRALDILRSNYRMYFLWEILDMRRQLLEQLKKQYSHQGKQSMADCLNKMYAENSEWIIMLEQLYSEFHMPKETFEFCYLYVIKGVACINDVIRIRRQMLNIKPSELCRGICDPKTLRRLENRKTVPQKAIVIELFCRLGLSPEYTRTELATNKPEVRQIMETIRNHENNRQWDNVQALLNQLTEKLSLNTRDNTQALMREAILLSWNQHKITNDEYCMKMQEILELTLPFNSFLKEGEKYLTYTEQICILNLLLGMDKNREEIKICIARFKDIYDTIINNGLQEAFSGIYELIIGFVESKLGDWGDFDQSDQYSDNIIENCLRVHRSKSLSINLYNRLWNYKERQKRNIIIKRKLNVKEELNKCILLSRFNQCQDDEKIYCAKLEKELI